MSPGFLNGFPTASRHLLYRFLRRKKPERNSLNARLNRKPLVSLVIGPVTSNAAVLVASWHVRCSFQCVHYSQLETGRHEMPAQPLDDVLRRVQGEYIEMPGLRLTTAQAQRLWGLDRAACDALLGALVDAKFLFRTRDGAFMRSDQARAART
jgi:hypothetical protein